MTDGAPIKWQQSREGYYVPQSFAPRRPDGFILWGYALAYRLTGDSATLRLTCRIADNILTMQKKTGLFGHPGRAWARTGAEVPLALLHLAAAIDGRSSFLPVPIFDSRFFHCEYHGQLEKRQQKRDDKRTYDHLVFYGGS